MSEVRYNMVLAYNHPEIEYRMVGNDYSTIEVLNEATLPSKAQLENEWSNVEVRYQEDLKLHELQNSALKYQPAALFKAIDAITKTLEDTIAALDTNGEVSTENLNELRTKLDNVKARING